MKWPQHRDDPTFRATAPYSFVPQAERVYLAPDGPFARHDRLDPDRLHGWIDLTIVTETPLYTRCAYPPDADPDDGRDVIDTPERQEPYHHGDPDRPVIPGSSIRGAIRNLVEILSASRLTRRVRPKVGSHVLDERLVHRAVADQRTPPGRRYAARFKDVAAGWLEPLPGGGWQIRPAQQIEGQSVIRVPWDLISEYIPEYNPEISRANPSPGDLRVWVSSKKLPSGALLATELRAAPAPGLREATLVPSGSIHNRKKFAAVPPPDPASTPWPIPTGMWDQWEDDRELKRGLPNRRIASTGGPVFYLVEDGTLTFFGPTLNFRVPYARWTVDYAPEATRLPANGAPSDPRGLDLAEALFGTVNDGQRTSESAASPAGAHRGRISFDDAICLTPDPFLPGPDGGRRYPSILSAPKPTSYQMYLVQPKPLGSDPKRMKENLLAWDAKAPDDGGAPLETTTLRGFKRFWHRGAPPDLDEAPPESEASERFRAGALFRKPPVKHRDQYTRIRPVRGKVEFSGRIRFENLTSVELGALITALDLPATCRHQLGMGKPHGMGTVRIMTQAMLYGARERYLDLTGIAGAPDVAEVVARGQEAFRKEMIRHHNDSVRSPKLPETASVWDISRLAALREVIEWDRKPSRQATTSQSLASFKQRLPLPSPFGVQGRPAPSIDADVPPAPAGRLPAAKPRQAREPEVELRGTIVRFSHTGIKLRVEGVGEIVVPMDIRVFPLEVWPTTKAATFPTGMVVRVTRVGSRVTRVVPEPSR